MERVEGSGRAVGAGSLEVRATLGTPRSLSRFLSLAKRAVGGDPRRLAAVQEEGSTRCLSRHGADPRLRAHDSVADVRTRPHKRADGDRGASAIGDDPARGGSLVRLGDRRTPARASSSAVGRSRRHRPRTAALRGAVGRRAHRGTAAIGSGSRKSAFALAKTAPEAKGLTEPREGRARAFEGVRSDPEPAGRLSQQTHDEAGENQAGHRHREPQHTEADPEPHTRSRDRGRGVG